MIARVQAGRRSQRRLLRITAVFLLTAAVALLHSPAPAAACSCAFAEQDGFIPKGEDLELPSNAKGVLFLYRPYVPALYSVNGKEILIGALPPAPSAGDFTIRESGSGKALKAVVRRLSLPAELLGQKRTLMLKDAARAKCIDDYKLRESAPCTELFKEQYNSKDWLGSLEKSGVATDVTEELTKRIGVFRIEPESGFTPGASYVFSKKPDTAGAASSSPEASKLATKTVRIGASPLSPAAGSVTLEAEGGLRQTQLEVPAGGSCSENVPADVQSLRYSVNPALKGVERTLLLFTSIIPSQGAAPVLWSYRSSVCSGVPFGRSDLEFAKDLVFAPCASRFLPHAFESGAPIQVIGHYGVLEVEDELHQTNQLTLTFPKRDAGECSTAAFLKSAASQQSAEEVKRQICGFGGWQSSLGAAEFEPLLTLLIQALKAEDPSIRICSAQAFQALGYESQRSGGSKVSRAIAETVVPALVEAASSADVPLQQSALKSLTELARASRDQQPEVTSALGARAAALGRLLKSPDQKVRISTAEILEIVGPAAKASFEDLRAALSDEALITYTAPRAIARVDPFNPATVPLLIGALKSKTMSVDGEAAHALAVVGAADERVVPALIEAAPGNVGAIEALGQLGIRSAPAAEMLLGIAKSKASDYVRSAACRSLAEIGARPDEVIAVLLERAREPEKSFGRQQAIESLGKLGPKGISAVPALGGIL